jgi:hypothetical protein
VAVDHGVFKNTLTALMELIFADTSIRKQVASGHVIEMTPLGIPLDPGHERRLKAYGYSCAMQMLLEHSLGRR